jgi:hypothetical protein
MNLNIIGTLINYSDDRPILRTPAKWNWSQIATGPGSNNSNLRFQLTAEEYQVLRSQIVTSSLEHGIRPEEDLKKLERRVKSAGQKMIQGSELPERLESGE